MTSSDAALRTLARRQRLHPWLVLSALLLGLTTLSCGDATGPGGNTDPAAAEIVTTDLENFWEAVDGGGSSTPYRTLYLDRASPGLREFARKRDVTARSLQLMVLARSRYFGSIRAPMLELARGQAMRHRLHRDFARFEEPYPAATFPPVTLLVGRFGSGGIIGDAGIMIGTEFYTATAATPRDELEYFERMNARQIDSLPFVVAHELTHVQQVRAGARPREGTLLSQALIEGAADFVAEVVAGGHVNPRIHAWALPREAEVWADFRDEIDSTDTSRWLYNQGTETFDRPGDLGYFVGYRITKAYYDRAPDKRAAIREIIRMRDARAFLTASGYDPR